MSLVSKNDRFYYSSKEFFINNIKNKIIILIDFYNKQKSLRNPLSPSITNTSIKSQHFCPFSSTRNSIKTYPLVMIEELSIEGRNNN